MSYPKVSICIPSYCEPMFLEEAIRSCLVQSYRNFEIIVSDDTPDDSIAQVVARYSAEDTRIRYFRNTGPRGAAANSNFAVRQATGEWIKFLYHDDAFVCEESLALFVANSDKAELLFSPCVWSNEGSRGTYRIGGDAYADLLRDPVATLVRRGNVIGAPSAFMVRRKRFVPFDETMVWMFDVFSYVQMVLHGTSFHCLDEPAVLINLHKGQLTEKVQNDPVVVLREGLVIARYLASQETLRMLAFRHALCLAFSVGRRLDYAELAIIIRQSEYLPMGVLCAWLAGRAAQMVNVALPGKKIKNTLTRYLSIGICGIAARRVNTVVSYLHFLKDYISFKKQQTRKPRRFVVRWQDRYPCIHDKTTTTGFDAHYIYHPAWAARILARLKPEFHIDISSSLHFCTMVSAFLQVRFYDYRPAGLHLSGLTCEAADLLALPFADGSVCSLSCMHVVEHVGLGRYGDPLDPDGDLKAIAELKRVLSVGGNLLFVVPVGTPKIMFNAHRIYSYEQVVNSFAELELLEFALIPDILQEGGMVEPASKELADAQMYGCGCFRFRKRVPLL